jgi:tetratricopeptide (TPR) repeat protein
MKGTTMPASTKKDWQETITKKLMWVLAITALIVYANTLFNDFAYDDFLVIKENTFVKKGLAGIPDILTTPYHKGFNSAATELYRPISLVAFAFVHQFFGANPFVFHLLNTLVFAACVVALFLFLRRLFGKEKVLIAFIASILFALHPTHTEVVANCKGLDDLLCFLFAFAGINMLISYQKTGKKNKIMGGSILYLLSFLSKETAITLLAVVPIIFYGHYKAEAKRNHTIILALAIAAIIGFAMRYMALGSYDTSITEISFIDNPLADTTIPKASRLSTAVLIMGKYLLLLFVPWPLVSDYSFNAIPFTNFGDPLVLLSAATYIALIVWCAIRLYKSLADHYGLAVLFFLATIALFSNIVFLVGVNMAERFLFFPSVGFCIIIALSVERLLKKQAGNFEMFPKPLWATLLPICILYMALTIKRNSEWKDNLALYTADIAKSPNSSRINFMLGNELASVGRKAEAIPYLQQAVAIYPQYAAAQLELGKALYGIQNFAEASAHAEKALQLLPNNIDAAGNLGDIYMAQKRYDDAMILFTNIVQREPRNTHAHFNLGAIYANIKKFDLALKELKTTISLDPTYAAYAPYQYIARIYEKMAMQDSAQVYIMQLQSARK